MKGRERGRKGQGKAECGRKSEKRGRGREGESVGEREKREWKRR